VLVRGTNLSGCASCVRTRSGRGRMVDVRRSTALRVVVVLLSLSLILIDDGPRVGATPHRGGA
jgi:hypothetical protein